MHPGVTRGRNLETETVTFFISRIDVVELLAHERLRQKE